MSPTTDTDRRHLARAIELAELGRGRVSPNPLVGAVIALDGETIGEGYHTASSAARTPRSRRSAAAGDADLDGATIYVSLEPCCHHGKTPPCTEAIRDAGIARVVSPPTTRPSTPRAAASGSCATRGSRWWSPTASWRRARGC